MSTYRETAGAGKAARARTGFFIHLAAFAVVNALLVGLNLFTNPDRLWFYWVLLGWGLGLAAHGIAAFALAGRRARR